MPLSALWPTVRRRGQARYTAYRGCTVGLLPNSTARSRFSSSLGAPPAPVQPPGEYHVRPFDRNAREAIRVLRLATAGLR